MYNYRLRRFEGVKLRSCSFCYVQGVRLLSQKIQINEYEDIMTSGELSYLEISHLIKCSHGCRSGRDDVIDEEKQSFVTFKMYPLSDQIIKLSD